MKNFANFLRQLIPELGYKSQSAFAEAANLPKATITNLILDGERPTPRTFSAIANLLRDDKVRQAELIRAYMRDFAEETEIPLDTLHHVEELRTEDQPPLNTMNADEVCDALKEFARYDETFLNVLKMNLDMARHSVRYRARKGKKGEGE